jgi:hypothetical protein
VEFLKGIAMSKPLAKSLHTVTVLVRVARLHLPETPFAGGSDFRDIRPFTKTERNALAVLQALETLGLGDMPDTYGLVDAAIKQLNK